MALSSALSACDSPKRGRGRPFGTFKVTQKTSKPIILNDGLSTGTSCRGTSESSVVNSLDVVSASIRSSAIVSEVLEPASTPCVSMNLEPDEFGLSQSARRKQIKLMEKHQRRFKKIQDKIARNTSLALNAVVASTLALDQRVAGNSAAQKRSSAMDSNALFGIDADGLIQFDARDSCDDMSSNQLDSVDKGMDRLQHHSSSVSSELCDDFKKTGKHSGRTFRGTVDNGLQRRKNVHQHNINKERSMKTIPEWPSIPKPGIICQAGCDNPADAHFSCSHYFCGDCLAGVRRHQKKKKPQIQKLYCSLISPVLMSTFSTYA